MFELPPARKEFPCRNKRKEGPGDCDQMIYKDSDGLVKNVSDGRGGIRGKRHECPDRVGTKFHHTKEINPLEYEYQLRHKLCGDCMQYFDSIRNPLCPICYRLECRKCHNMQQWINNERLTVKQIKNEQGLLVPKIVVDETKPEINNDRCNMCNSIGMDVRQVWNAYQRLYGKYEL